MSNQPQTLNYAPFEPIPKFAPLYTNSYLAGGLLAYEFSGWRDETISWKKTAYLHAGLNAAHTLRIKGQDTFNYLSRVCVNSFEKFPIGSMKQGVMCNEDGLVIAAGVILRTGEYEAISYWMLDQLTLYNTGAFCNLDLEIENLTGKVFLYQVAGPVSIDILEAACSQSLRDLKFLRIMDATIAGKPVRIYRVGMAGTLAYEVHGVIEDAHDVYNAVYETGQPYELRRLGHRSYPMNHAENGFPQYGLHFLTPPVPGAHVGLQLPLYGSLSDNIENYYRNPYELGWGKLVKFDHCFTGRVALEKISVRNKRKLVTLEWNLEDILDVFASQFRDEEPYKYIESPRDPDAWFGGISLDKVINDNGEMIGVSAGRQNSAYFRRMISICSLDTEYSELGTEVLVVWGEPGSRQKSIRATVVRYPYNNVLRNETTDVTQLPRAHPQALDYA